MGFPNAQNNPAAAIPVWLAPAPGSVTLNGISEHGSVGTSGADVVVTANQFLDWVTIQNTHTSQMLYISFNNPATTSDIALTPGGAMTLPHAATNTLYGIGSGAATTWAVIGF
jgi:hypothetical protein